MGVAAQDPFSTAAADAAVVAARTGIARHDVAVVLGSGWGPAADGLGTLEAEVRYVELSHFPPPTVAGHTGRLQSRRAGGAHVLVLQGRSHLYEGHPPAVVVHGVRVAVAAGCGTVVLTNAAGSLRPDLGVGQPVLVADHLNLTGRSPLEGPPAASVHPPRFVDLTDAYSPRLRDLARGADPSLPEGVYAALPGPHYETPAEIRMLRTLGADLIGMSTALETIAARHLGAEVLAVSLVTNVAAGLSDEPLHHGDVLAAGAHHAPALGALLRGVIDRL